MIYTICYKYAHIFILYHSVDLLESGRWFWISFTASDFWKITVIIIYFLFLLKCYLNQATKAYWTYTYKSLVSVLVKWRFLAESMKRKNSAFKLMNCKTTYGFRPKKTINLHISSVLKCCVFNTQMRHHLLNIHSFCRHSQSKNLSLNASTFLKMCPNEGRSSAATFFFFFFCVVTPSTSSLKILLSRKVLRPPTFLFFRQPIAC